MLSAVVGRHRRGGEQARVFKRFSSLLLSRGARRFADTLYSAYTRASAGAGSDEQYAAWLAAYDGADPSGSTTVVEALAHKPLISIVMPVYNTPDKWLRRCIESVRAQSYPHWQLCIADDASPDPSVRRTLEELSRSDDRINVVFREENGHISRTSNSALELARGEFTALLDHDDELHPDALLEVAKAVNGHPEWEVIYSDEDKIDEAGRRFDPYFKSDWNYDLFLSHNCISHLGVYRTSLMRDVGGFRCGFEGSQDWDLALRCIEKLDPARIGHIPRVLYHWRAIPGSTALAPGEKNYAHLAAVKSIQAHLDRIGRHARVEPLAEFPGNYRVVNVLEREPLVSLVIPTRDQVGLLRQCVDSILRETAYRNYEIIIIDNQSSEAATLAYLKKVVADERVRVIAYDAPFNYSAINNLAAENATGEILALVNNDIEVISSGWLTEMVSQAMRPDIGAVGAMLYFPDDTIQHAGVLLGFNGIAVNMYGSKPRGWLGQLLRAQLIQNYSAVTAACLVVRKDVFEEVDGFDERLGVAYNDVDFCLRLREKGYRNLWTPYAELYHHESASRGAEDTPEKRARFEAEVEYMYERWGDLIGDDPAYNPNLATYGDFNDFAFPPRGRAD